MIQLKKLIAFAALLVLAQASLAQECSTGNIEIVPELPIARDGPGNVPLSRSEIAGVVLRYRIQNSEETTEVFMTGDSCFIDIPLPNSMMITGTVVDVNGSRTIDPKIFFLTINENPTDPVLPDIPDTPAPPGGVEMQINVPEGYTVQLKVL